MTVSEFLSTKKPFQRVYFVAPELKGKPWGCCASYPSNEELLSDFANDECEYEIVEETDCIKKSLIVYTDKLNKAVSY